MLYNIYKQNVPSVTVKGKGNTRMFEMDLELVATIFVEQSCPIEMAKKMGYAHPVVECVNGYNPETGKPNKS